MTTFSFKFLTTPSATAAAAAATATGTTMSVREFRMSQGLAPVHRAARGNDVSTLAKLLASGVNANLKTANDSRHTPLMMAAERGHIECVRLLVEHGAQIEARDWEGPAAFKACVNGHTDVICYFLFKGANVNARSTDGVCAHFQFGLGRTASILLTRIHSKVCFGSPQRAGTRRWSKCCWRLAAIWNLFVAVALRCCTPLRMLNLRRPASFLNWAPTRQRPTRQASRRRTPLTKAYGSYCRNMRRNLYVKICVV